MAGEHQVRVAGRVIVVEHDDRGLEQGEQIAGAMLAAVRRLEGQHVFVLHDASELTAASHDYAQAFAQAFREMRHAPVRQVAVIPRAVPRFFARVAITLARTEMKIVPEFAAALGWIHTFDPEAAAALERHCAAAGSA